MSGNRNAEPYIPFFFYGTLRHGQENYVLLRNYTISEIPACAHQMALYSLGTLPMMIPGDGIVHGELTSVPPHLYHWLLEKIDMLEGCRPNIDHHWYHRQRISVTVESTGQVVEAWAYVGSSHCVAPYCPRIPEGDWVKYRHRLIENTRFARYLHDTGSRNMDVPK